MMAVKLRVDVDCLNELWRNYYESEPASQEEKNIWDAMNAMRSRIYGYLDCLEDLGYEVHMIKEMTKDTFITLLEIDKDGQTWKIK